MTVTWANLRPGDCLDHHGGALLVILTPVAFEEGWDGRRVRVDVLVVEPDAPPWVWRINAPTAQLEGLAGTRI